MTFGFVVNLVTAKVDKLGAADLVLEASSNYQVKNFSNLFFSHALSED